MFIEAAQVKYLARCLTEILNLQPFCPKFSSLTTSSLPLWRMRSQEEWCYVHHTDSDLFCVWYHVTACHWLMLPASPLWWLDPWLRLQFPYKISFFLLTPKAPCVLLGGERASDWSYFKERYCFIVSSILEKCYPSLVLTPFTIENG